MLPLFFSGKPVHNAVRHFSFSTKQYDMMSHFNIIFITGKLKALRKQAYLNILQNLPPKNENFQIKILIFFIFLLKTKIVGTH